jgi:hypothetical protein
MSQPQKPSSVERISVSNLDYFRAWKDDEDMPLAMLLARLSGTEPQTDNMKAGNAFHEALEHASEGELGTLALGDYRFDFNCDANVEKLSIHELPVEKMYGDLLVRGRVDGLNGKEITDHKTTTQFDADRLMGGYQWRYYLDMMDCDRFRWEVFVIAERGEYCYEVTQHHTLTQKRYPGLGDDCARLAREYSEFISERDYHIVRATREPIKNGDGMTIGEAITR